MNVSLWECRLTVCSTGPLLCSRVWSVCMCAHTQGLPCTHVHTIACLFASTGTNVNTCKGVRVFDV